MRPRTSRRPSRALNSRRRAFTLIELIVVILIIAILAALIVPNLINRAGQAKVAKAQSDIAVLNNVIGTFKIENDRFPTQEEGLSALTTAPSDLPNWKGPYTTKGVSADPWGNPYEYVYPVGDNGDNFLVRSYGSDGVPGGTGDAADIPPDEGP